MCVSGKTYDITVCDSLYILLECYEACEDAPQFVLGPWRLPLLESLFGLKALRPRNVVQPPPRRVVSGTRQTPRPGRPTKKKRRGSVRSR